MRPGSGARTTALAMAATVLAVIPVFLLGAVAVLVRAELRFDEARLGLAVSCFYATTALTSVPAGRIVDRLGARLAVSGAVVASGASLAGIGLLASSWASLTAFLVVAGAANAFAQPASNLALASEVQAHRMGMAFGLKQSAIPVASLVAGTALPVVALTVGWRWAFLGTAVAAVAVAVLAPGAIGPPPSRPVGAASAGPPRALVILALGCAFGSAAGIAMGAFLVQSAMSSGLSARSSGLLLAGGGVVGVLARLLAGWLADRREGGHLVVVTWMLGAGATGFAMLAAGDRHVGLLVAGTLLCFALAWGWPGLYFLAIIRLNPDAPAAASGMGQAGGAAGGVVGPLAFGAIVTSASYSVAWMCAGGSALVAALLMAWGRRAFVRRAADASPVLPVAAAAGHST